MAAMFFLLIMMKWGIFVQDILNITPVKLGSNWLNSIQPYVIKFVSNLLLVFSGFLHQ
jgi:hypothetical protein